MFRRIFSLDGLYFLIGFIVLFFAMGLAQMLGIGEKFRESIDGWLHDTETEEDSPA